MNKNIQKELIAFLKNGEGKNLKGLQKLKTIYRPYICPFDLLLEHIPDAECIFDLGCGAGSFLSILAHFKSPEALGGIEIKQDLIDAAKLLLAQYQIPVSLSVYNGNDIPEEIVNFNYVTMIDVFHHIPPAIQEAFISQLYTKMNAGSVLVFKDIDAASPFVYFNKMHDLILSSDMGNEYSASRMKGLLEKTGFSCSEIYYKQTFWYPHFYIIAKK